MKIDMKILKVLVFTLVFSLMSVEAYSKAVVSKVNGTGKKVMLDLHGSRMSAGQKIVFVYKGKKVGEAQVQKVNSAGSKAIAVVSRGKTARGVQAMDAWEFENRNSVAKEDPWASAEDELYNDFDDDPSSKKRKPSSWGNGPQQTGFVSGYVGYDLELMDEYANGGLSFGGSGIYKLTEEYGVGGHLGYTMGTVSTKVSGVDDPSLSYLYLMADGVYFLQPNFYVGASLGFTRLSVGSVKTSFGNTEGTSETKFSLGGLAGYDYFFTENLAASAKVFGTYIMDDDALFTMNLTGGVSYWF